MQRTIIGYSAGLLFLLALLFGIGFTSYAQSTGTIKGKVTGDGNVALANVIVRAYYKEDIMGIIQWSYVGEATTNGTGNYTISNLNASTYHISFNEFFPVPGYLTEFYNNAADQVSATDIPLAAGATVSNINVKLSSGAHVKGKVTDQQGNPVSGIRVVALDANNTYNTFFDTGTDGLYDIGSLQPGNYRIAFDDTRYPPIYRRQYYNNAKEIETATPVTLATEQILNNINAKLDQLSFITGKVTNAQGTPLPNIQLIAQRRDIGEWGELWLDLQFADTDSNGNYALGSLFEGVYRVRFRDTNALTYSAEYYNNVTNPAAATLLTVTLNTTTTNINAQLALRGRITGRVTNRVGTPLENVEVSAEYQVSNPPENSWQSARTAYSDANGDYTICCLDEGAYRLRFKDLQNGYLSEYYSDVYYDYYSSLADVTLVQVMAEMTTTGINAQLSRPSKLVSHVIDQRNQPISNLIVTLYGFNPEGGGQWLNKYFNVETVNDSYQIAVAPGRYRIAFADGRSPARYGSTFYDNATTIDTATDITVTEETTVTIQATLTDRARITGRVIDPDGKPIPDITVNAYQPFDHPSLPWAVRATTMTDQKGEYSLDGIDPGSYRVGFADTTDPVEFAAEYYDNVATPGAGRAISVTENQVVTNIDAQLARLGILQGRVTDQEGTPLTAIEVLIYRIDPLPNQQVGWQPVGFAQINEAGFYTSPGLAADRYRISFRDFSDVYRQTFYNNVGYLENATTITLTSGITVIGLNVQLPRNPFTWPPFAQDDQMIVTEGGTSSTLANGFDRVTANDRADSGNTLQANLVAMPAHGTLVFNPDGTFSYTHNGDEATSDFFTYSANDGTQSSNVAKVTITIQPVNDAPIANIDSASVARGQRVTTLDSGAKSLLANDNDPDSTILTATLVTAPAHGAVTINANGTFTYTHNGGNDATDSFTYQAADGFGSAAVSTVTLAINPFSFSKTVGMAGIQPLCTPVDELHTPVGTTIVYCYTIHNVGDTPLTTHSLVDSHLGVLLTNHAQTVAPGAVFSVTFTQTLTVSTTNVATWTATSGVEQASFAVTPNTAKTAATVLIAGPTDDTDQDSIPDNLEKAGDTDGDNVPNFLDTDADGDGKLDKDEIGSNPAQPVDGDQDGVPDYLDAQSGDLQQQLFLPLVTR
jgi:VCBS repeat-containing protein